MCVAHIREVRNVYGVLFENSEGKKPLGRLGDRWDDNKMALKEIGWLGVD